MKSDYVWWWMMAEGWKKDAVWSGNRWKEDELGWGVNKWILIKG